MPINPQMSSKLTTDVLKLNLIHNCVVYNEHTSEMLSSSCVYTVILSLFFGGVFPYPNLGTVWIIKPLGQIVIIYIYIKSDFT